MNESPIVFGNHARLVGIRSTSDRPTEGPMIVFLNAGLLHRVGPHRLHVDIARCAAEFGVSSFRFDLSGVGESGWRDDHLPFEQSSIGEVREAMDELQRLTGAESFILVGLCSGAMTAVKTAVNDRRVRGIVAINTQSHTTNKDLQEWVAEKSAGFFLWRVSFFNRAAWGRLLRGRSAVMSNLSLIGRQLRSVFRKKPAFRPGTWDMSDDFEALAANRLPMLLVFSEGDPAGMVFDGVVGWRGQSTPPETTILRFAGADHTFTPVWSRKRLVASVVEWIRSQNERTAR